VARRLLVTSIMKRTIWALFLSFACSTDIDTGTESVVTTPVPVERDMTNPCLESIYGNDEQPSCDDPVACGDVLYINCGIEVDGPYYYCNTDGGLLAACSYWQPSDDCPPDEWTCD
jgi:hypothetical protein